MGAEPAVRISVPESWAEIVGTLLLDRLGPYQETGGRAAGMGGEAEDGAELSHLLFFPFVHGSGYVSDEEIITLLPRDSGVSGAIAIERILVPGGWEDSWKEHFRRFSVGRLRFRPPWSEEAPPGGGSARGEPSALADGAESADLSELPELVLSPGLAFGTGLHPTTRSLLALLQRIPSGGPLVDAGTGSGILALAASRLRFSPIRAFDNDPLAVEAAKSNAAANGIELETACAEVDAAPRHWFEGATVAANITLNPILSLFDALRRGRRAGPESAEGYPAPSRVLVAGILCGQEPQLLEAAGAAGLEPGARWEDGDWISCAFERSRGG